jgi:hypothetical protein
VLIPSQAPGLSLIEDGSIVLKALKPHRTCSDPVHMGDGHSRSVAIYSVLESMGWDMDM